jgi:Domain of unknown function (DUF397)
MTSDMFTDWRKATCSHGNGNCVEVAVGRQVVGVRDAAQAGRGQLLQFSAAVWRSFIAIAKHENA